MSKKLSFGKKEFIEAVKSSSSIAEALKKVGLSPSGGNYRSFRIYSIRFGGVDSSHFTGQAWNKGKKTRTNKVIDLKDILTINSTYTNMSCLKGRLFREGLLKNSCYECDFLPMWRGKPMTLSLDHINGDSTDNRIENLRILCPNCHSQTETFGSKNNKEYVVSDNELKELVNSKSLKEIGEMFSVSTGSIRDRCRRRGITTPKFRYTGEYRDKENSAPLA
jgi:hypothetical protein